MKSKLIIVEPAMSLILVTLLIIFLNPTNLLMPETFEMMLMVGIVIAFLVFSGFIWKEKTHDERDEYHRLFAGRISFLAGTSVLVVGIVYRSLHHNIDPWLIYALIGMVLAKTLSRLYSKLRQ